MRLVHHETRDAGTPQRVEQRLLAQALRRDVDQLIAPLGNAREAAVQLVAFELAVEDRGLGPRADGQAVELVLHKGDER